MMDDLDKLIAAVEAGTATDFRALLTDSDNPAERAKRCGWASSAYKGRLDAALQLHEALLPGWRVKQLHQFESGHWLAGVYHPQNDDWPKWTPYPAHEATSSTPARAWLLAILRAVKAKSPTTAE